MKAAQDRRGGRRAGFSLVELLAGFLAAAVLAVTAGSMLWYGYLAWRRTSEAVALQRDSRVAMDVLTRALRGGANMTFASAAAGLLFTQPGKPRARVYAAGRDLFYVPDVASGGAGMKLVGGTLDRFNVWGLNSVTSGVRLVLSTPASSISNQVVVSVRN